MHVNRLKRWFAVCGTSLSLLLAIAGASAQSTAPNAPAAPAGPKLAEEEFKNIQALKGIPADQLIPSMQFIAASLGVECEFCHVAHANEKEDKKAGETKATLPSAEQLLDKYLAAIGGADALQKITSRVQKGTITAFGGQHFPVDVYSKAPDKRLSVMHLQGGDSFTGFDGKRGWLSVPGRVHMMSAAENAAARIDADLYLPAHLKTLYQEFRVNAGDKIDGHETYMVVGQTEGQPPLRLYLDKESGLLLRLIRYAETPLGRNPTQIDYADYRDANGVKMPFRWTLARPGNRFIIQIEQVQQNFPVDDAKFAPPPASATAKP